MRWRIKASHVPHDNVLVVRRYVVEARLRGLAGLPNQRVGTFLGGNHLHVANESFLMATTSSLDRPHMKESG